MSRKGICNKGYVYIGELFATILATTSLPHITIQRSASLLETAMARSVNKSELVIFITLIGSEIY